MSEHSGEEAASDARCLTQVHCWRMEAHASHRHVNEGPRGGCGLPEWCDGTRVTSPAVSSCMDCGHVGPPDNGDCAMCGGPACPTPPAAGDQGELL